MMSSVCCCNDCTYTVHLLILVLSWCSQLTADRAGIELCVIHTIQCSILTTSSFIQHPCANGCCDSELWQFPEGITSSIATSIWNSSRSESSSRINRICSRIGAKQDQIASGNSPIYDSIVGIDHLELIQRSIHESWLALITTIHRLRTMPLVRLTVHNDYSNWPEWTQNDRNGKKMTKQRIKLFGLQIHLESWLHSIQHRRAVRPDDSIRSRRSVQ